MSLVVVELALVDWSAADDRSDRRLPCCPDRPLSNPRKGTVLLWSAAFSVPDSGLQVPPLIPRRCPVLRAKIFYFRFSETCGLIASSRLDAEGVVANRHRT